MVNFCPLCPPGSLNSAAKQGFSYRALMAFLRRLVLGSLMVAGTTGLGVGVWALVTPREPRRREIAKVRGPGNYLPWDGPWRRGAWKPTFLRSGRRTELETAVPLSFQREGGGLKTTKHLAPPPDHSLLSSGAVGDKPPALGGEATPE